jgi:hypothetical protein
MTTAAVNWDSAAVLECVTQVLSLSFIKLAIAASENARDLGDPAGFSVFKDFIERNLFDLAAGDLAFYKGFFHIFT